MAVAYSYANKPILGEPFEQNGKMYVNIQFSTNKIKTVRWYTDQEYRKIYPGATIDHSNDPYYKSQKELLGFKDGFIIIFTGDTYTFKEYLKGLGATYRKWWGWGLPSDISLPADLPTELTPHKLLWTLIGSNDGENLRPDEEVVAAVESLIYPSDSEFYGEVGSRITLPLTVVKNILLEGYYGTSHLHTFEDGDGNVFIWITAAKNLPENSKYTITGTIKEHKIYKNTKQTILTRCKVVEND